MYLKPQHALVEGDVQNLFLLRQPLRGMGVPRRSSVWLLEHEVFPPGNLALRHLNTKLQHSHAGLLNSPGCFGVHAVPVALHEDAEGLAHRRHDHHVRLLLVVASPKHSPIVGIEEVPAMFQIETRGLCLGDVGISS